MSWRHPRDRGHNSPLYRQGVCFKNNGGGQQTQTAKTELPPWVDTASQENWGMAKDVSANLKGPYQGNRVAALTPEQLSNIGKLQGNVGSGDAAYDQAEGMANGLAGFNSGQVTPAMLRDTNLQPYMDPFTGMVIDPTMKLMEQSRRQALNQVGDQATQSKAFGGSRQGIAEGVTNAQSELEKGRFAGDLWSKNFQQAQGAAVGDISRGFEADKFNLGARQFDAGFQRDTAKTIAGLADSRQANFLTGMQSAMTGQDILRQQEAEKLKAAQDLYNEEKQHPLDQLAIRQNALANSPYGQTVTTTKPGPTEDVAGKAVGMASAAVGMAGSIAAMV